MKTRSNIPMHIAKTGYIVISAIMIVIGFLFILLPDEATRVLALICGISAIVFGVIKIIGYFSKDLYRLAFQFDIEFGVVMIILGVVILLMNRSFVNLLSVLLGVVILIDGMFKIRISLEAKNFGIERWWVVMALATITCLIGAVMVLSPAIGELIISIWLGISLISEGTLNLCVALTTVKIIKNQKQDYIDAEYFEEK